MSAVKPRKQPRRRAAPKPNEGEKVRLKTLDDLDKRTRAARDTADLRESLAADLGGWDEVSVMEQELITSAALVGAMIRHRAASYLEGQPVDMGEFMSLTNSQRRLLSDLGYDRRGMRNVTPWRPRIVRVVPGDGGEGEGEGCPSRDWQPGDPPPRIIRMVPPECGTGAPQAPPLDDSGKG